MKEIEQGGTAMNIKTPSPAVVSIEREYHKNGYRTIFDFGAGHGRNAQFLRKLGYSVYAYDPNNGKDEDGWVGVSNTMPTQTSFDAVFSAFVLNVLVDHQAVIDSLSTIKAKAFFHIVRNDIKKIKTFNSPAVIRWGNERGAVTENERAALGFPTVKGYQKLVSKINGYEKIMEKSGYITFKKKK